MKKETIQLEQDDVRKYSWATTIEKEAGRLRGVKQISMDFEKRRISVEYDEKQVDRATIDNKIRGVITRFKNKGFLERQPDR